MLRGWASTLAEHAFHLNFGIRDGRLTVHLSDQEEEGEWEGDNRENEPFV